jgi:hypothetical protein
MLLEGAEDRTDDTEGTLYANTLEAAMRVSSEGYPSAYIAMNLAHGATPAQLAAVNPRLIAYSIRFHCEELAYTLLHAGVDFSGCQPDLYHAVAAFHRYYLFHDLVERGGDINADHYGALRICYQNCDVRTAIALIEHGADYAGFRIAIDGSRVSPDGKVFLEALDHHIALKAAEGAGE